MCAASLWQVMDTAAVVDTVVVYTVAVCDD